MRRPAHALALLAVLSLVSACSPPASPAVGFDGGALAPELPSLDADDGAVAPPPLRIGGFNVRRLGLDAATDVSAVARILEQSFDVLGVMEIMQTESGGHPGLDALMRSLGPHWAALVTESARPLGDAPYAEHYAILYRPERVAPCTPELALTRHAGDGFVRAPAFTCLTVQGGRTRSDLVLVVYHALWGDGSPGPIEQEVARLDSVLSRVQEAHPGEGDVVIVGDFNLAPERLDKLTRASLRTRGTGSTLAPGGERTTNLYDHLLVHDARASRELVGDAWVLDARASVGGAAAYYAHVSDHLPVVALWRTDLGDDD